MAWFLRMTDYGPEAVYGQMGSKACGIACVMMVNLKMKKWKAATGSTTLADAFKSEKEVYKAYAKVTGAAYNGTTDTFATRLAQVLNQLGLGTWAAGSTPTTSTVADSVMTILGGNSNAPIILLVNWGVNLDGGGHFVVCDAIEKTAQGTKAVICDPWDGSARIITMSAGQSVSYQPAAIAGQVDFGQTRRHYDTPGSGTMNGWMVWQTRP